MWSNTASPSTPKPTGGGADLKPVGQGVEGGAFFRPTLLLYQKPLHTHSVPNDQSFGRVSTLKPYDCIDQALQLAVRCQGSPVGKLVTKDPQIAARVIPVAACRVTISTCTLTTLRPRPA